MLDDDLPDPQYAPLVEAEVQSVVLDVYELHGGKWKPVYDHDGNLVQMLPSETMRDLSARVTQPGLYRVVARDPSTQKMVRRKDWSLRPTPTPGRSRSSAQPDISPAMIDLFKDRIAEAQRQRQDAVDQLREERKRWDATLDAERKRSAAMENLAREQVERARERARESDIELAGLRAMVQARQHRIGDLEDQLADMKSEVEEAQVLTADLKKKAKDNDFSPLDAILQMDQALEVLGKTAERFNKK